MLFTQKAMQDITVYFLIVFSGYSWLMVSQSGLLLKTLLNLSTINLVLHEMFLNGNLYVVSPMISPIGLGISWRKTTQLKCHTHYLWMYHTATTKITLMLNLDNWIVVGCIWLFGGFPLLFFIFWYFESWHNIQAKLKE